MAGGKETPRQKMIGMMYLVLTALLALNVSKQIVAAFITLNDKLDASTDVIYSKSQEFYGTIDKKRAALVSMKSDLTEFNIWDAKAKDLKSETSKLVGFILGECNDMIKESEGVDWIEDKDNEGNITKLKPLDDIAGMDNYDIPTSMFVGGNPKSPIDRGKQLVNRIHDYRDFVCELMGTYEKKSKSFSFTAPKNSEGLTEALKTANHEDTAAISQFYRSLTIPEELHAHGEEEMLPWISVTFDHAPIVAAAAMFTSLKLDIKNAEAFAARYVVDKIDAPIFNFNKIEPVAIAPTAYINQGDSLPFNVMIAAYDSNDVGRIKWGMDADTIPERWKETTGGFSLSGSTPGPHKVKGVIGVSERGDISWKPWEFNYNVGQPMGVVAQPDMRVLYIGYNNVVEATASGFPADKVSMSGNGCRIVKQGNKYVAKVERGTRKASITVRGQNDDGTSVSVGTYEYKCMPLPDAQLQLGTIKNGDRVSYQLVRDARMTSVQYGPGINLDVDFTISGGTVKVDGVPGQGRVLNGGALDDAAKAKLRQSRGKDVMITVDYRDPAGTGKKAAMMFNVRS